MQGALDLVLCHFVVHCCGSLSLVMFLMSVLLELYVTFL